MAVQTLTTTQWSLQCSFDVESSSTLSLTLSWGSSEELLVGSDALRLYETLDEDHLIWNRQLANTAIIAVFSQDASLIASVSRHDRLAKVWRRRSYGSDDIRFDYSYLSHPSTVTGAQWRRPEVGNHHEKHVLYTVCADLKVRIWAATDPHALQLLQLWTEIDMQASIQPRIETATSALDRHVFLIDSLEFSQAISSTVLKSGNNSSKRHFIEHLLEIDMAKPDICVVLDSRGHISAWALDQVGTKAKSRHDAHNIAHLEDFNALSTQAGFDKCHGVQMLTFASEDWPSQLCVLVHRHDGSIVWWEGEVTEFFDPSINPARLKKKGTWLGHENSIEAVVPSPSGDSLISWSSKSEAIIWKFATAGPDGGPDVNFIMESYFESKEVIVDACLFDTLDVVITLHEESVSLWTIQQNVGRIMKRQTLERAGHQRSIHHMQTATSDAPNHSHLFAIFTPPTTFTVWTMAGIDNLQDQTETDSSNSVSLQRCFNIELDWNNHSINSTDPTPFTRNSVADGIPIVSVQQNEIVLCLLTGHLYVYKLQHKDIDGFHIASPSSSLELNTGVDNPCLVAISTLKKLALVDEKGFNLTIWDLSTGKLETSAKYITTVKTLRWLETSTGHSALAVGFEYLIIMLVETRLDQSSTDHTLWTEVRKVEMKDQTSQLIKDFLWLGGQILIVASGIQLLAVNSTLSLGQAFGNDSSFLAPGQGCIDLPDALEALNCSLPVYHPQHVLQMTLAGQAGMAQKLLTRLHNNLKFFSDGDSMPFNLGLSIEHFYSSSVSPLADEKSVKRANGNRQHSTVLKRNHRWPCQILKKRVD